MLNEQMETTRLTRKLLDDKIPRDVISSRASSGGRSLSYLEGWYVIDRLNQVLGQGKWQYETEKLEKTFSGEISKNGKQAFATSYIATVRLTAEIDGNVVTFSDVGAGSGIDYNSPLTIDESASKEAVTDGIKRCAKSLGMSLGLALYDKSQEFVEEEANGTAQVETKQAAPVAAELPKSSKKETKGDTLKKISATAAVVIAKKLKGKSDVEAHLLATYQAKTKEDLTETQAKELLTWLEGLLK